MNTPGEKVFVALSGGVDSSVAAALLKKQGVDVMGIHIKMWSDPEIPCTQRQDRYDAMRVAAKLDIPFETWDLTEEYKAGVVDYMVNEYAAGRTPNPDVMCNSEIKFGAFLNRALNRGANFMATGHYARKLEAETKKSGSKNYELAQARDSNKDQSYFLWTLTQEQLRRSLFPIGEYLKSEVRDMAKNFGLPTAEKKDSQGLCFIGKINVGGFLRSRIPERRGAVLTSAGHRVGEHSGVAFYTIGQRHGLGISIGQAVYVAEKDCKTNTIVVAASDDRRLYAKALFAKQTSWISGTPPVMPGIYTARIRYRQPLQTCEVYHAAGANSVEVRFKAPQRAATPGQSIVFYNGPTLLGGGVISDTIQANVE